MSKWLSASALAVMLALPAFAQSSDPAQSQGIEAATPKPSGDFTPSTGSESKNSGQPAEAGKTPRSGGAGAARPADRALGTAKPADEGSSADAYKKDFEKK